MGTKKHTVSIRLSEKDLKSLQANAEEFELTPSEYLRYLIRIPAEGENLANDDKVIVVDKESVDRIRREIVRWGHHYNQGIHALNSIAYYAKNDGSKFDYFVSELDKANRFLEETEQGRKELIDAVESLVSYTLVEG